MDQTFDKLYEEFMAYADRGDEQGAREFLIANLDKFPEDVQEKITFAFFEEAMQKETAGMKEVAEMQKEGLEAIKEIEKAQKILGDKKKAADLSAKLKQ